MSEYEFLARLQAQNRVQIPVEVRLFMEIEPGDLISVESRYYGGRSPQEFLARVQKGWRFTIPWEVMKSDGDGFHTVKFSGCNLFYVFERLFCYVA